MNISQTVLERLGYSSRDAKNIITQLCAFAVNETKSELINVVRNGKTISMFVLYRSIKVQDAISVCNKKLSASSVRVDKAKWEKLKSNLSLMEAS